ncbi:MAG: hypothetical protein LBQ28_08335 [Prevotellaceae bacterium]|jgi:hypothetical protein|nr:hypothetical protein [Prevotellaceae bacterium]
MKNWGVTENPYEYEILKRNKKMKLKNKLAAIVCGLALLCSLNYMSTAAQAYSEYCFDVTTVTKCGTIRNFRACDLQSAWNLAGIYEILDCGL